jgi:hypothetical protein
MARLGVERACFFFTSLSGSFFVRDTTMDRFPMYPSIVTPILFSFFYKDRNGFGHIVDLDNRVILKRDEPAPKAYFYFSDNCDIGDALTGIVLTMAVTSGDKEKIPEFRKRLDGFTE